MLTLTFSLLLVFIGISSAVVLENIPVELEWSACPNPRTVQNFKPKKFAGDWFDAYRYTNALFTGRCGKSNFKWRENNKDQFNFTYSNLENTDSITLRPVDLSNGVFRVYRNGRRTPLILYVLDTDYNNYSVIWTCTDIMYGVGNAQTLNILSRNPSISSSTFDKAKNVITDRNLDQTKLKKVHQSDDECGSRSSTSDYDYD